MDGRERLHPSFWHVRPNPGAGFARSRGIPHNSKRADLERDVQTGSDENEDDNQEG